MATAETVGGDLVVLAVAWPWCRCASPQASTCAPGCAPLSRPMDGKEVLRERLTIPLRGSPRVTLVELDGDEVVVRIVAK
jgi:hypothetical protein